ncbi:MAG TPA: type II CAAX endopeptidase family protein [Actinomycetota bacterium]|nr:type II CAAX endopeptidase family protein [Actinomycetota bacterium]
MQARGDTQREPGLNRYLRLRKRLSPLFLLPLVGGFFLMRVNQLAGMALLTAALVESYVSSRMRRTRDLDDTGFGLHGAGIETAAGFGLGAILMALMIGILAVAGWYRVFVPRSGITAGGFAYWLALFALVGVLEELLSRGMLFRFLERRAGSAFALAASSLVFGLLHVPNPNSSVWAGVAIALHAGVLLGAAYMLTRRLWLAIGIHWSWNFVQGPVFGAPVSGQNQPSLLDSAARGPEILTGGPFGPEAGLVSVVVGAAAGLLLLVLAIKRGRWVPSSQGLGWRRKKNGDPSPAPPPEERASPAP